MPAVATSRKSKHGRNKLRPNLKYFSKIGPHPGYRRPSPIGEGNRKIIIIFD
jgi:hypothetical protein